MAEKKESLERTYVIPLRSYFRNAAPYRKTNRAVRAVQIFLTKHMKSENVKLGQHLNNFLWQHGIKNPPPRVTVVAIKDAEGVVRAELQGKGFKESVKSVPKEEATGLKEKLAEKLGGKEPKNVTPKEEKKSKETAPKKAKEEKKEDIVAEAQS